MLAHPNIVELLHGMLNNLQLVGQDVSLKVALVTVLLDDAGSSEVDTANVHLLAVKH